MPGEQWLRFLGGGLLLYFGAEWLVGGASALALAYGVPQLIIGLTVVAYGTSAPEIVVGVQSAWTGHGEVAVGNVIGSNIANIGLILGVATLVRPARVAGGLRRRELPVLVGSTLLVPWLLRDGKVSRLEGAFLVGLAVTYSWAMIAATKSAGQLVAARRELQVERDAADVAGAPSSHRGVRAFATAAAGLCALLLGGSIFLSGAIAIARTWGVSERVVGLILTALGTSLPELITGVIAAERGHSDITVGNVLGSNIFNVLFCLGASALVRPLIVSAGLPLLDQSALIVFTLLAALFIRTERTITRAEGAILLALYALFTLVTVWPNALGAR